MNDQTPYGYCPICGAPGLSRERRPDGNDHCTNGCTYPSKDAVRPKGYTPPVAVQLENLKNIIEEKQALIDRQEEEIQILKDTLFNLKNSEITAPPDRSGRYNWFGAGGE